MANLSQLQRTIKQESKPPIDSKDWEEPDDDSDDQADDLQDAAILLDDIAKFFEKIDSYEFRDICSRATFRQFRVLKKEVDEFISDWNITEEAE